MMFERNPVVRCAQRETGGGRAQQITVVHHWFEELQHLVVRVH